MTRAALRSIIGRGPARTQRPSARIADATAAIDRHDAAPARRTSVGVPVAELRDEFHARGRQMHRIAARAQQLPASAPVDVEGGARRS